ncbi:MAG: hypothetical protein F6J96_26820 [Symploca sp. SIO1C2]|nr:hypothetical protein [Symploca sp. SIO1C2]
MKRRKFLEYGALGSAAFIANLSMLTHQSSGMAASGHNKRHYDWILLYWMPYDNDLSGFGQPILHMLIKGVQSDNILVAVESDFSGTRNLSRRVITKGKVDIQQLKTVNSAREDAFAEYLNWAQSQFVADNWAIIFLGHGGRLDQVSPDNHAGLGNQTQWMNIQKLRDVVAQFNQDINDRVELFFFQNCNKGTIEAHYTLHDVAEYTLSSQKLLGAPNHYYESLLQFLSYSPEVNGGELAEKIIQFERSDMYNSYTVTNNRIIPELPVKLNPLLEEIIAAQIKTLPTNQLKSYSYMGERYVDFVYFLQTLCQQTATTPRHYAELVKFLKNSMIHKFQQNPNNSETDLSGLGLFLPQSRRELEQYLYLPVFRDLKLVELFDNVLF